MKIVCKTYRKSYGLSNDKNGIFFFSLILLLFSLCSSVLNRVHDGRYLLHSSNNVWIVFRIRFIPLLNFVLFFGSAKCENSINSNSNNKHKTQRCLKYYSIAWDVIMSLHGWFFFLCLIFIWNFFCSFSLSLILFV